MKKLFTILFVLIALSFDLFSQAVGDYGSKATGNWSTAGTWSICVTTGTWTGATTATAAPSAATNKNVWIRAGHTITATTTAYCINLNVESGGILIANANYVISPPSAPTFVYVRVYGTTVVNNGNIGNAADDLNAICIEQLTSSSTLTISGSGTTKLCRFRPGASVTGATFVVDQDMKFTYTGSTYGGGGAGYYSSATTNDNITFTLNSGRTVTCVDKCNFQTSATGSANGGANTIYNINGTLTMGTSSNIALGLISGKTATFNINGTVNAYSYNIPTASLGTNILNINSGGLLKVTTSTCDAATLNTTTVNGTIDFNTSSTSTRTLGAVTVNSGGKMRFQDNAYMSSGTVTLNSGAIIEYYGSSAITHSLPVSYKNLLITNSAGVNLGADATVDGTLTLSSGNINTGAYSLYISSTGSVSRTSGQIVGNLKKNISIGATSKTFEIGDATNYTPVTVAFGDVTVAGDLTAKSNAGAHPSILSSGINSSKSVARYWSLTNSGITFNNCNATFNFVPGDILGSANTSNFIGQAYNSTWGSVLTMGTLTSTSSQGTGITSFGDFVLGEVATTDPAISISGSLTNFGLLAIGSVSTEQSYTVAGVNLGVHNITIAPPTGFEISLGTGISFVATNPIILPQSGGFVASTTIYVRFAPATTGAFTGSITHISSTASQNIATAGTAISVEPATQASAVVFSNVSTSSMTVSWTDGNGSNRLVVARAGGSASATSPVDAVSYTGNTIYASGTAIGSGYVIYTGTGNSVDITGLTEGVTMYFAVYEFNGSAGAENYKLTPATGIRGVNIVTSTGTGNWSSTASWLGGIVPTSTDNVKINSTSTITVDSDTASCKAISFLSTSSSKIIFATNSVLNLYGDFNAPSTNPVSGWAAGAKLKFTGSAAIQTLLGLSTSKTSTSQFPFMEIVVDKSAGKVMTPGGAMDYTVSLGTSLEIINGTFELGDKDDINGVGLDLTTGTQPTITIQSGGIFSILGGATSIRSGTSGANPIGKVTVAGQITNLVTTSTLGLCFGNIDILNGGTLTIVSGWTGGANLFKTGLINVYSGGTWNSTTTSNVWVAGTVMNLNSGATFKTSGSSTVFPPTFNNSGTVWYDRTAASPAQTIFDMNYTNLKIGDAGSLKNWALAADRVISGSLTLVTGGQLELSSTGNLTVNGTIDLTGGSVILSANNLILGHSATFTGTPSASSMIVTAGTGSLVKSLADVTTLPYSFTFPVGDTIGTDEYSPATVTLTSGTLATASISVKVANAKHASNSSLTDFLNRNWTLAATGITGLSADVTAEYVVADVNGTEANLYGGVYRTGEGWTRLSTVNSGTHRISGTQLTTLGDFSAGEYVRMGPFSLLTLSFIPEGYYTSGPLSLADQFDVYAASASAGNADVTNGTITIDASTYSGTVTFPVVLNGSYYIYVKGRAIVETWSATPIAFSPGVTANYDFTTAAEQAYGGNLVLKGTKYCIYTGDANQDNFIDNNDLLMIDNDAYNFESGYRVTDLNGDLFVDNNDLLICDNNAYNFIGTVTPRAQKPHKQVKYTPLLKEMK